MNAAEDNFGDVSFIGSSYFPEYIRSVCSADSACSADFAGCSCFGYS